VHIPENDNIYSLLCSALGSFIKEIIKGYRPFGINTSTINNQSFCRCSELRNIVTKLRISLFVGSNTLKKALLSNR